MSEEETVQSFASLFAGGFAKQGRVEKRIKAEKRSAMSNRQRSRGAVRTVQLNFRTSAACKALASGLAKHLDASIPDVVEEALAMYARAKGYEGDN